MFKISFICFVVFLFANCHTDDSEYDYYQYFHNSSSYDVYVSINNSVYSLSAGESRTIETPIKTGEIYSDALSVVLLETNYPRVSMSQSRAGKKSYSYIIEDLTPITCNIINKSSYSIFICNPYLNKNYISGVYIKAGGSQTFSLYKDYYNFSAVYKSESVDSLSNAEKSLQDCDVSDIKYDYTDSCFKVIIN